MKPSKRLLLIFLLFPLTVFPEGRDPFSWDYTLGGETVRPGEKIPLEVSFQIPPKHFLYKEKIGLKIVEGEGFELGPFEFSPSRQKRDPFFGKELEIFEGGAVLRTTLKARSDLPEGKRGVRLELTYQGCSEALCYRLTRREWEMEVVVASITAPPPKIGFGGQWNPFRQQGFLWSLLIAFLGGLASDFTPCVLPIIPITLTFIGVRKVPASFARNLGLTFLLVLSMAVTYAVTGLLAALLGKGLGFLFQNLFFLILVSLLYLVFSLSLFGLFEIQLPFGLRNRLAKLGGEGPLGAVLAGLTVGFLAAPCVGPVVASLLLYVVQDRNAVEGFILLFAYGLGMGSLFLTVGAFFHRLSPRLHSGPFTFWMKKVFAVLLLIPAVYYGSVAYGLLQKKGQGTVARSEEIWLVDAEEGFARASAEGRPIFVDFFASWCLPCVEMEARTFADEGVQRLLADRFIPIKVDCTEETPQCVRLVERYGVVGWPTFLILTPQGEIIESVAGKSLSAAELRQILEKTLATTSTPL